MSASDLLRIALLTYATKPRGSVVHTLEVANALTALGHTVGVFALDKDGRGFERSPQCTTHLIPTAAAPTGMDALIQQRIQEMISGLQSVAQEYDIYHAQDCISANALLQWREKPQSVPIIRTIHHVEDYESPYLQQCQERSIYEPDLCFCVSDRWQQILKNDYKIDAPRVTNGVNLDRFSPVPSGQEATLRNYYDLVGAPIFLTVGGIEPRKNSIRLLQAFAQVLQLYPKSQLVIAGGSTLFDYQSYREHFFQTAQALNIDVGRSLLLPGNIPEADLPALYRLADVFCFPSLKEGWGLVTLEAIASHLPVITANTYPFTEFLTPNQALLVNPEDPEAIAQAMLTALNPILTQSLVQNSQSILSQYTWQHSAQLHLNHYQQCLRRRNEN
ncbi:MULTISPECIES: MSMEG_0565 family glycosyltransferase [unclassified Leptolyngbya]|uniref:MSMEG_0565 family glycosyltransferase n=1 Tax=unclassified Leptolyngbya TaxID=2650499 RepID=UPI0016875915|nr:MULTISPECIES: MSMEG_0565 family glycosyltransferase [unclassified Leptolyngbya]MBD1911888.1 MSMEG_0565 family glycosyltransferase [Leptolyngbya sp. FACHB-8]MBD2156097.1 MSMEG_0565 family glycosyltransferase [Leptolyngbya sp. FACHB-16]